jgi:hypothetical protein
MECYGWGDVRVTIVLMKINEFVRIFSLEYRLDWLHFCMLCIVHIIEMSKRSLNVVKRLLPYLNRDFILNSKFGSIGQWNWFFWYWSLGSGVHPRWYDFFVVKSISILPRALTIRGQKLLISPRAPDTFLTDVIYERIFMCI